MLCPGYWDLKSSISKTINLKGQLGLKQLNSLSHLELVINSDILLPVPVGHGDLQLVISLAGQTVEVVKAKPALSLMILLESELIVVSTNHWLRSPPDTQHRSC